MQEVPNLNYIQELSGEDNTFEQKFIGVLQDEFPEEMQTYLEYIEKQGNLKNAAEVVHKLKHKFNILSMHKAYALAVNYEEELIIGNDKSHADFMSILIQIKTYLKTI